LADADLVSTAKRALSSAAAERFDGRRRPSLIDWNSSLLPLFA
jgi:hypothetical protein